MSRRGPHVNKGIVKRKLGMQLIGVFLIVSLIPCLLIGYVSIRAVTSSMEVTLGKYSQKIMDQLAHSMNETIVTTEGIEKSLIDDMSFGKLIMKYDQLTARERLTYEADADKKIGSLVNNQVFIEEVYVFYKDQEKYRSKLIDKGIESETFLSSSLYTKMKNQPYESYGWYQSEASKEQLYVAKKMTKEADSPILIALLNKKGFQDTIALASIEEGIAIEILDASYQVLVGNDEGEGTDTSSKAEAALDEIENTGMQTGTFVSQKALISFAKLTNGWQVILSAPMTLLMKDLQKAWGIMGIILTLCILVGFSISIFMSRRITEPIVAMANLMKKVEDGNLNIEEDIQTDIKVSSLEVGILVKGFSHMLNTLKVLISNAKEVTEGVKYNTVQLEEVANHTASSAKDVELAIESLAIGAEEQRNEIESALGNIQRLADHINEVTDGIEEIEEASKRSMTRSTQSKKEVELLWSQTQETLVMNQNMQDQVNRLGDKANNIGKIIEQINGINDQTNLLALNASIEAARAGQFGLGFAVVAQEVRNLSEQIQSATLSISKAVQEIQEEKQATLKELTKAMGVFDKQVPVVEATKASFEAINEQMLQVDERIHNVTELLLGVQNQKTEVIEEMKRVSEVVEQAVSISEEVSSTSEEQSSYAKEIKDMVVALVSSVENLEATYMKFA
ncbi:methyl-accepting chemotaxis protein [Sporanaerobium hydrogeniformans]|uniref:methyl-accepting chemotaxis protein n=1 Tax=Sporanaerobium hydrogeniformans TaxID=3072179 RepID=UPI0015D4ADDF|nr:methyl-accepting chemotaxis protein [Sporanaerobium hydrogeniformans]